MTYEILIGALGLIGLLAGIVKPIITLNTNIAALRASIDQLQKVLDEVKVRVTAHGQELDDIRVELADHEARIKTLER